MQPYEIDNWSRILAKESIDEGKDLVIVRFSRCDGINLEWRSLMTHASATPYLVELILHWDIDDGCNFSWVVLELRGVLCANIRPLNFTFDPWWEPVGGLKKTWVMIPDTIQLVVIQNGLQDGCLKILNSSFYQVIYQIPWFYIQETWLWHYFNDPRSFWPLNYLLFYRQNSIFSHLPTFM